MPEGFLFTTREMLEPLKIYKPPATFFSDYFFPDVKQSLKKQVEIDVEKGGRKMASFVHPRSLAKTVEREAYEKHVYQPPYIKEQMPVDAEDVLDTIPGMTPHPTDDEVRKAIGDHMWRNLQTLADRIVRRIEWMCREALWYGQVRCVGEGVDETINFQRDPAHTVTLTGDDRWGQQDADILADLDDWATKIGDAGFGATDVILGRNAAAEFLKNEEIRELLKTTSGVQFGTVDLSNLPSTVRHLGEIGGMRFWRYTERYFDEDTGTSLPLVPDNEVLVVDREARRTRHFGPIRDLKAIRREGLSLSEFATPYFPKIHSIEEPSADWLILQSAPLPVPHAVDASVRAVVMS